MEKIADMNPQARQDDLATDVSARCYMLSLLRPPTHIHGHAAYIHVSYFACAAIVMLTFLISIPCAATCNFVGNLLGASQHCTGLGHGLSLLLT